MPLDPSISLQVRQFEPPNMLAQYAQVMGIQGAQNQNRLADLQYQNALRQQEDQIATQDAFRSAGGDTTAARNALMQRGLYGPAMALDKSAREQAESTAKTGKTQAETYAINMKAARDQLAGMVNDQASYSAWRTNALRLLGPEVENVIPPQFSPKTKAELILTGDEWLKRNAPTIAEQNVVRGQDMTDARTRAEGAANRGVTMRGQNMTDARSKAATEASAAAASAGKVPPGYRTKPDGSLEAIPGGPADEKTGDKARKMKAREEGAKARAELVSSKIDEALGQTGFFSTGFVGSQLGKIPGMGAYDLKKTIDTVKANIGFQELQAMREASPTGGALGQVAVQELNMLQAVIASLDEGQSEPQLRANLAQAKKHFENWKKTLSGDEAKSEQPQRRASDKTPSGFKVLGVESQ